IKNTKREFRKQYKGMDTYLYRLLDSTNRKQMLPPSILASLFPYRSLGAAATGDSGSERTKTAMALMLYGYLFGRHNSIPLNRTNSSRLILNATKIPDSINKPKSKEMNDFFDRKSDQGPNWLPVLQDFASLYLDHPEILRALVSAIESDIDRQRYLEVMPEI